MIMLKRAIKKLVARYQRNKLAKRNLLRQQHNDEVTKSILKDLDARGY